MNYQIFSQRDFFSCMQPIQSIKVDQILYIKASSLLQYCLATFELAFDMKYFAIPQAIDFLLSSIGPQLAGFLLNLLNALSQTVSDRDSEFSLSCNIAVLKYVLDQDLCLGKNVCRLLAYRGFYYFYYCILRPQCININIYT